MAIGSAADIGIRVFLDDAAGQGLFGLNSMIRGIGTSSQLSGAQFAAMAARMSALGVVIGAGASFLAFADAIKFSVNAASEFQQSMFAVAVATHVPMVTAMQYANQLMNLAANSTYSSQQIADGIVLLGRSNFSLQDIMGKTVDGMHGMAAAGVALGIATRTTATQGFQMLAQAMAAYNTPASQAMQVADLLQFAFEHQRGSVSDLTTALSQVTPAAAQFNIPLRDIVAALDVVGPAMKSTGVAGSALRYMISGLYSPTAAARTEMVALKLATIDAGGNFHSAFYDAHGNAVDFTTSLQILKQHLSGMNQEAQSLALHSLFSVRGGQGADILIQQIQKYLGYLGQLRQSQDNAGGAMSRWQQAMATFAGAMAGLSSSVKDLGVVIGLTLLPFLTNVATGLNHFVSWIRQAAQANPAAASTFLMVGLAVSALGVVAGIAALAIMGVGIPIMILGGVILGVMALVAGFTVGISLLILHWHQVTAAVSAVIPYLSQVGLALLMVGAAVAAVKLVGLYADFLRLIPAAVSFAVALLTQTIPALLATVLNIARATIIFIGFAIANAGTLVPAALAAAGALLVEAAAAALAALPFILLGILIAGMIVGFVLLIQHLGGMNLILNAGRAIWSALVAAFQQAGAAIRGAFLSAIEQLRPVWQQLVQAFFQAEPALLILGKIFGGVLAVAIAIFIGVLRGALNVIVAVVIAIIGVVAGLTRAFMGLIQFFMGFFQLLHGLFTGNGAEIQAALHTMAQGILNIFLGLWGAVKAIFVGAFSAIVGFVSGFVQGIVGFFHWLAGILVGHSIIPDMLHAILNVFMSVLNAISVFVQGILARIGGIFSAFGSMVHGIWTALWSAVQVALMAAMNAIISIITGGMFHSVGQVVAAGAQIISAAHNAWNNFTSAVRNGIDTAVSIVSTIGGRLGGILAGVANAALSWGANIVNAIANGIRGAIGAVGNAIGAVAGFISSHMPHSPAKMGPLRELPYQSSLIPQQIAEGILTGTPHIQGALNQMLGSIAGAPGIIRSTTPTIAGGGGIGGGGGATTIPVYVDGRMLFEIVMNRMTGTMQMNGMARAFR